MNRMGKRDGPLGPWTLALVADYIPYPISHIYIILSLHSFIHGIEYIITVCCNGSMLNTLLPPVPHVWDTRNAYAPQPIDHSVWFNGLTGAPLYARFLHFNMLYSALALDTAKHVAVWCGENLSVLDARDPF